jgi:hypothetical protein
MVDENKPVKIYRAKALSLSMWENDSENGKSISFSFQRSYKDKQDNWQHTQNLRSDDLAILRYLIDKAYEDLIIREIL